MTRQVRARSVHSFDADGLVESRESRVYSARVSKEQHLNSTWRAISETRVTCHQPRATGDDVRATGVQTKKRPA
jgi:hypothetical protein